MRIELDRVRRSLETRPPRPREAVRRAAVGALLRHGAEGLEIAFIRRAVREGDPWSGQMAFPGGKQDEGDTSLLATAVRETHEELGIDLASAGVLLGQLDDVAATSRRAFSGLIVTPFVWHVWAPEVVPNPNEVEDVHWASVEAMLRGDLDTEFELEWESRALSLPGYRVGSHTVWGLTHRILEDFLGRLRASE